MRYFVYSTEAGYTPHNPYFENDGYETCKNVCDIFSTRYDITAYVVDRKPKTMYEEVYISIGSNFKKDLEYMRTKLADLKK